jgi:addiction module RelE/StbE family toxin
MNIDYSKSFDRQFAKLSRRQKQLAIDTIELFIDDPFNKSLRNHPLKDKWINYRSITADDDLRLHYRVINKDTALFAAVGTHDQLYK